MDAVELKSADGTQRTYACGKCRLVGPLQVVMNCCLCHYCGEYVEQTGARRFHHDACYQSHRSAQIAELLEQAEKLESWEGWVYCERFERHNNGYFESVAHFLEYLMDEDLDDESIVPEFVFIAEPTTHQLDLDSVLECLCADGYEDMMDDVQGIDGLKQAIDVFNAENEKLISYYENTKKAVAIGREVFLKEYHQSQNDKHGKEHDDGAEGSGAAADAEGVEQKTEEAG